MKTYYYETQYPNYLMHFGVKGMKWGVRRYQNEDGTLTNRGKNRYESDETPQKQGMYQRYKSKVIQEYKDKGYGDNAAVIAANRKIRTQAIIGATAAVSVAVIGTTVARRIGQDYFDKTLKAGMQIQNIGRNANATFQDKPFYAAINKNDKRVYGKMFVAEQTIGSKPIYSNKIRLKNDVRVASVKSARDIFYDKMDNDKIFRDNVMNVLSSNTYARRKKSARKAIDIYNTTGKKTKNLYDAFNMALPTTEMRLHKLDNDFYSALKEKGYDAILDVNDARYARKYKNVAKSPTIFFGKDKWEKIESTVVWRSSDGYKKAVRKGKEEYVNRLSKKLLSSSGAVLLSSSAAKERRDNKIVQEYIKKHPNTDLSDKEILEMINKKR